MDERILRLSPEQLFSFFVRGLEIEISAGCNRRCDYCPQSIARREQELMPLEMFREIVVSLKKLGYAGGLAFHQYNEPLLDLGHLHACIDVVGAHLPKVAMKVFTNGDLLTPAVFEELKRKNVRNVIVGLQLQPGEPWDAASSVARCVAFGEKLGVRFEVYDPRFGMEGMSGNTALLVGCADLRSGGSSRLGVVKAGAPEKTKQNFCSQMLNYLNISYAGVLYPCCQCCHGIPEHGVFALGSLHEKSLLELFEAKLPLIRDFLFGEIPPICRRCNADTGLAWTFK